MHGLHIVLTELHQNQTPPPLKRNQSKKGFRWHRSGLSELLSFKFLDGALLYNDELPILHLACNENATTESLWVDMDMTPNLTLSHTPPYCRSCSKEKQINIILPTFRRKKRTSLATVDLLSQRTSGRLSPRKTGMSRLKTSPATREQRPAQWRRQAPLAVPAAWVDKPRRDPWDCHRTADQLGWCQGGQCRHIWQSHGASGKRKGSNMFLMSSSKRC